MAQGTQKQLQEEEGQYDEGDLRVIAAVTDDRVGVLVLKALEKEMS